MVPMRGIPSAPIPLSHIVMSHTGHAA